MKVVIRRASSFLDFEYIRRLRNKNRVFLTGNTRHISFFRQLFFWIRRPSSINLYIAQRDGQRCGYLLLRRDGEITWITEVVDARFRGRGIAREMIGFAAARGSNLTAEIQIDNEASIRLHKRSGFIYSGGTLDRALYTLSRGST